MEHQIIKQPNGLYSIWSTVSDSFVVQNASISELIDFELAGEKIRITDEILRLLSKPNEDGSFSHFMTWEEAKKRWDKKLEESLRCQKMIGLGPIE